MSTSAGRKAAQTLIDMVKHYDHRTPSKTEVLRHLNRSLSPDTRYTGKGFDDLWNKWLKK
ncbi:MAG: hypothetical protein LBK08_10475 [Treponema sp.]|jgi:hypothetical protein|nr:hypothetical protein [Treponema sp.]